MGGRTEDTDRTCTDPSLCPAAADGKGQICSVLPCKALDKNKGCRKAHRQARLVGHVLRHDIFCKGTLTTVTV